MFIAVYEFQIKAGKEGLFKKSWLKTTEGIYRELGSQGSRLHATEKADVFIGYAQWPTREKWSDNSVALSEEYIAAREAMRACIKTSKTIYELEVVEDYLQQTEYQMQALGQNADERAAR